MTKDWYRFRIICVAAVVIASGIVDRARGGQSTRPGNQTRSARPTEATEVPFELQDGYLIVVEATVGQRKVKFALDTGSTYSVLRADLARGLEIVPRRTSIVNLEGVFTPEQVNVPDFQWGPVRISQLAVIKNNLSYLRSTAPDLGGLIGLDVLHFQSFSIDFKSRKIKLGPQRLLRSNAPMEIGPSYLAVEVCMLGRPARLLLDTAARTIMLYRDRMADQLLDIKVEQRIRGASLSGDTLLEVVTLPSVQLNKTELRRRAVLLSRSPAGLLPDLDGYLSIGALRASRVSFDFERRLISWE